MIMKMNPITMLKRFCTLAGSARGAHFIAYMSMFAAFVNLIWSTIVLVSVTKGFSCEPDNSFMKSGMISIVDDAMTLFMKYSTLGIHGFFFGSDFMRFGDYYDQQIELHSISCYDGYFHVSLLDAMRLFLNYVWMKTTMRYFLGIRYKNTAPMVTMIRMSYLKIVMQILTIVIPTFTGMDSFFSIFYKDYSVFDRVMHYVDIFLSIFVLWAINNHLSNVLKNRQVESKITNALVKNIPHVVAAEEGKVGPNSKCLRLAINLKSGTKIIAL